MPEIGPALRYLCIAQLSHLAPDIPFHAQVNELGLWSHAWDSNDPAPEIFKEPQILFSGLSDNLVDCIAILNFKAVKEPG